MSDVSNGLKISTAHQPCILTLRPSSRLYLLNLMAANHQDDHDRHGNCQTGVSGQRPCSIYGICARPPRTGPPAMAPRPRRYPSDKFGAFVRSEIPRWTSDAKAAGIEAK